MAQHDSTLSLLHFPSVERIKGKRLHGGFLMLLIPFHGPWTLGEQILAMPKATENHTQTAIHSSAITSPYIFIIMLEPVSLIFRHRVVRVVYSDLLVHCS